MKRSELFLTFIQLPLDFLALVLAGWTAYAVRFSDFFVKLRAPQFNFDPLWYLLLVATVALGWLVIFALAGLYTINPNRKLAGDIGTIIFACSTGLAAITIYIFLRGEFFNSRFIVLAAWVCAILFTIISHTFIRVLKAILYRLGVGTRRTVIIGPSSITDTVVAALRERKGLGYNLVQQFDTWNPYTERALHELHTKTPFDELLMVDPALDRHKAIECIEWCSEHHVTFKYSADLFATLSTNIAVSTIAGMPIVELKKTKLEGWGHIVKWFVDMAGAMILIVLTSPIMLLTALATLIETGRPIIYKNERIGRGGKSFYTFKFRSMHQRYCIGPQFKQQKEALKFEEELIKKQNTKEGPVYKIKNDPRVTRVGRFIRRWSIDELPQFFNVIGNTMSLVGPRPHQPREVAHYAHHHKLSLALKPGITGLAQISGRSDLEFEEETRLDAFYTEHWTLLMDLFILLKTPFVLLKKRKAL